MAEAVAILLDVGPHMDQAPPGVETPLQTSLHCIQMILQRKMFAESKDEVALVLFSTDNTANELATEGNGYDNISVAQPLCKVSWPMLEYVHNEIQPSSSTADFMDALVVACDHLMKATLATKKKFDTKSIVLFSNLAAPFGDDQADEIITGLKNSEIDLTVIGPNLEESNSSQNGDDDSERPALMPPRKEKSAQQKSGELMIKQVLDDLGGECYSFDEAIQALSFFQKKSVKQILYKFNLETGNMQVPVRMCTKVMEAKTKTLKKVYARDPEMEVRNERTYHLNDEKETEVEKDDLIDAHRYGNTLVPFSAEDTENMKFTADKCLKILGFTKSKNVKRHHYLGSSVVCLIPEPGDEAAAVALSSIIHALYELDTVAIVRRVYQNRATPKIGMLTPHIKVGYECLLYTELPFAEDIRQYTFGSLPVSDNVPESVKKMKPSDEQLNLMDELITEMDLCPKDEDGNVEEILKPKTTFNPHRQRLFQCILHRGLHPKDDLPDLNPLVAESLKIPQEILTRSEPVQEKMKDMFKLVRVQEDKKEDKKTDGGDAGKEPEAKKARLDTGQPAETKPKVTEVTSVTPIEDFKAMAAQGDLFKQACEMMAKKATEIILLSFGNKAYQKALKCIKVLREECVGHDTADVFNDYMNELKNTVKDKKLKDFWKIMVDEQVTLISRSECSSSSVTMATALSFLDDEEEEDSAKKEMDAFWGDDDDDFLANL